MVDRRTSSSSDASSGEIAEMGEQLWYRLAARVSAGRGKWEARFARGIWVGKSEIDDTHLVMDLERGIQKVRTMRRIPEEFRWNAEMLQDFRFTPPGNPHWGNLHNLWDKTCTSRRE